MLHISTLMLFSTGFLTVLCPAVSIEVQPGENVMWCEHNIHVSGNLCWFKQTAYAVPITIVCMMYTESLRKNVEPRYFANFTRNHMIMDLYLKSTSLTILDVRVSDSGFYFCGAVDYQIKFGNGTRLEVKATNIFSRTNDTETLKNNHNQSFVSVEDCSGNIFLILTLIFGGFIIFTFIMLILVIIIKHRRLNQRKAAEHQEQQKDKEQELELVEYSAVHFSRRERQTDTIDVYQMYTDAT